MKSFFSIGIVCGIVVMASWPTSAQDAGNQLRIGALNIEWLGRPSSRGGPAKNLAQDPKDLAAFFKASGVSILALEEIEDDDGVAETYTNKTLDATCKVLNEGGKANWKYRLFAKHPEGEHLTWQLVGLAWNESVVSAVKTADGQESYRLKLEVPAGVKVGAPGKPPFERWATAMKFSAGKDKTDVVVIPVHFKSNKPAFTGQDTAAQREVEAKMLLTALPDVKKKFSEDDIIIIGDSNYLNKNESAEVALIAAGFVDLNSADQITFISEVYKNPFDRAFVPNPQGNPKAKEFKNSKLDVFHHPTFNDAEYRKKISDHRMIRITVDVMADDD